MKRSLAYIILGLFYSASLQSMEREFLSNEAITEATKLAKSSITCEEFRQEQMQKDTKDQLDYFTIEDFNFRYKENDFTFQVAVGFDHGATWGEIALYPGDVNLKQIKYVAGGFSDLGAAALYLANIQFEYVPATQEHVSYYILEKISAGYNAEGKGYSQACVSYFMNEFITKHTNVEFVFSDARNRACQHFFPPYGLKSGIPAEFKTVKFARPLHVPFYWQRQTTK
jgi:hypothetical protein